MKSDVSVPSITLEKDTDPRADGRRCGLEKVPIGHADSIRETSHDASRSKIIASRLDDSSDYWIHLSVAGARGIN